MYRDPSSGSLGDNILLCFTRLPAALFFCLFCVCVCSVRMCVNLCFGCYPCLKHLHLLIIAILGAEEA